MTDHPTEPASAQIALARHLAEALRILSAAIEHSHAHGLERDKAFYLKHQNELCESLAEIQNAFPRTEPVINAILPEFNGGAETL